MKNPARGPEEGLHIPRRTRLRVLMVGLVLVPAGVLGQVSLI